MKNIIVTSIAAISCLTIGGCASTPKPEKVCTSEWISKRSEKALDRIESKAGRSIKALTKAAESWARGKKPNLFQMMALQNSFKGLEKELKYGRGMKDLKTLASTCENPKIITDAMGGFLRKQGLPDNMIKFIEGFEPYQRLISPNIEALKTAQLLTE